MPLDYTLSEGPRLVLPLDAAPLSQLRAGPGVARLPRAPADGDAWPGREPRRSRRPCSASRRRRSRSCTGGRTTPGSRRGSIAKLLGAGGTVSLRGVPIPAGTEDVGLDIRVKGVPVQLDLVVVDASGRLRKVRLGSRGPGAWHLDGPDARVGAAVDRASDLAGGEPGAPARPPAGRGRQHVQPGRLDALGPLTAGGKALTDWRGFVTTSNGQLARGLLSYAFSSTSRSWPVFPSRPTATRFRCSRARTSCAPLPSGGVITLELPGRAGAGADRRRREALPGLAGPRPGLRRGRREPPRDRARRGCSRDVGAGRALALGPGVGRGDALARSRSRRSSSTPAATSSRSSPRSRSLAGSRSRSVRPGWSRSCWPPSACG